MQTLFRRSGSGPHYQRLRQTASYLAATETHTFASSVATHALLSFFPFIVLLLSLTKGLLHSDRLYRSLLQLLRAYLPVGDIGAEHTQTFIIRNLEAIVAHQGAVEVLSLVILLATCTGVFMPLEVALNQIWGAPRNRSYLRNWAIAIGLAFTCGVLGMLSASFTSLTETYSTRLAHFLSRLPAFQAQPVPVDVASIAIVRIGAIPFTIAMFFLVYWRLPNVRVPARRVLPAAIIAGLLWEVSKYLYILLLPWLNFEDIYGPFAISVSLVLWAYVSALILLTCAELAAPGPHHFGQQRLEFDPPRAADRAAEVPNLPPSEGDSEPVVPGAV